LERAGELGVWAARCGVLDWQCNNNGGGFRRIRRIQGKLTPKRETWREGEWRRNNSRTPALLSATARANIHMPSNLLPAALFLFFSLQIYICIYDTHLYI